MDAFLDKFITDNRLPLSYRDAVISHFLPLAAWIARHAAGKPHSVFGINGSQGSGKTTLAAVLEHLLKERHHLSIVTLSLDDLYLPRADRLKLADKIHPLLATRGVPGTHDIDLGCRLLRSLATLKQGESLRIPRFDKLADDRLPVEQWTRLEGAVDVVLFEGWCVGSRPQPDQALDKPVNSLEAESDADGLWRRYVNDQLSGSYSALFAFLDKLIFLQVPGMESVRQWRLEQEQKSAARGAAGNRQAMTENDIRHFVDFFERITRVNLESIPKFADVTIELDKSHDVKSVCYTHP